LDAERPKPGHFIDKPSVMRTLQYVVFWLTRHRIPSWLFRISIPSMPVASDSLRQLDLHELEASEGRRFKFTT